MSLYAWLLFVVIFFPFVLSFDKKLKFYKQWGIVMPSIILVASGFIVFDILLTNAGVWGFNPKYNSGILIAGLPIEEWLFFIIVPYACIFLHKAFILYFPEVKVGKAATRYISFAIALFALIIIFLNTEKTYTVYSFAMLFVTVFISFFDTKRIISSYYITFFILLVPFLLMNSVLTGSFIDEEVVWYSNSENLGMRVLTIPIEDFAYSFCLILLNLFIISFFERIWTKKPS